MMPATTKHRAVKMEYQGELVEIDRGMAPLIKAIWNLGIVTEFCCQGEPGAESKLTMASIMFHTFKDAERFLGIVCTDGELEPYVAAIPTRITQTKSGKWKQKMDPMCWAFEVRTPCSDYYGLTLHVLFPQEHIKKLTKIMKGAK